MDSDLVAERANIFNQMKQETPLPNPDSEKKQ